jgi:hypothetical protein
MGNHAQPGVWCDTPDTMSDTVDLNGAQSVRDALTRGRAAVDDFTRTWLSQGNPTWPEEAATVQLLMAVHPELSYVAFTRHEESQIGADWLWWFLDSTTREAFGLLVQAKKPQDHRQTLHDRLHL